LKQVRRLRRLRRKNVRKYYHLKLTQYQDRIVTHNTHVLMGSFSPFLEAFIAIIPEKGLFVFVGKKKFGEKKNNLGEKKFGEKKNF
jgi:hypothetical protein